MRRLILAALVLTTVVGCGASKPVSKLQYATEVDFIPAGSAPEFCKNSAYSREATCFATAPEYCKDPYFSNAPSCLLSAPEYCKDPHYAEMPTCFASAPDYCEDAHYSKVKACRGSMPNYCNSAQYAREPSCLRLIEGKMAHYCRHFDQEGACPDAYRRY